MRLVAVDVDEQRAVGVVDEDRLDDAEPARDCALAGGVQLAGTRTGELGEQGPAGGGGAGRWRAR